MWDARLLTASPTITTRVRNDEGSGGYFHDLVATLSHGAAALSHTWHDGGREQESNLPRIARRPQPGLKSGRPTGAASPPPWIIHRQGWFGKAPIQKAAN